MTNLLLIQTGTNTVVTSKVRLAEIMLPTLTHAGIKLTGYNRIIGREKG